MGSQPVAGTKASASYTLPRQVKLQAQLTAIRSKYAPRKPPAVFKTPTAGRPANFNFNALPKDSENIESKTSIKFPAPLVSKEKAVIKRKRNPGMDDYLSYRQSVGNDINDFLEMQHQQQLKLAAQHGH